MLLTTLVRHIDQHKVSLEMFTITQTRTSKRWINKFAPKLNMESLQLNAALILFAVYWSTSSFK